MRTPTTLIAPRAAAMEAGTILIRGIEARCIIGVRAWERQLRQKVRIDVSFDLDLRDAGESDDIVHTVDYKRLKDRILGFVATSRFRLLEGLAAAIADLVLEDRRVAACEVLVEKPGALTGAESVAVRLRRRRGG